MTRKKILTTLALGAGAVAAFAVVRHVTKESAGAHHAGWHGGHWGHWGHGWGQQHPTYLYGGGTTDPYAAMFGVYDQAMQQPYFGQQQQQSYFAQQPYIPPVREIVDGTGHVTYT